MGVYKLGHKLYNYFKYYKVNNLIYKSCKIITNVFSNGIIVLKINLRINWTKSSVYKKNS